MLCPHCERTIPAPPDAWKWLPPWQCSSCAGLYGVSIGGMPFRIPSDIKPLWPLFSWFGARQFGYYAGARNYVYALCYPSGLPFYVGRGVKLRVSQHAEEVWKRPPGRWTEKHFLLMDFEDKNETEWYHFLALVETAEEAAAIEQKYIQEWGTRSRGGLLVNRVRPMLNAAVELPREPVAIPKEIAKSGEPLRVHHPLILTGEAGKTFDFDCPICLSSCLIPLRLSGVNVQCPHCAHYFNSRSKREVESSPILFGYTGSV